MAVTLEQITGFLAEHELKYAVDPERQAVLVGFAVDADQTTYRDGDGNPSIQFVIRLMEEGEFVSIFVPQAWNIGRCPNKAAVFEALATIQGRYKMLRFDYDPADGEVRPNVEVLVEDFEFTADHLHRLMHCIYQGVQRFDGVIRHAMTTGEVSFASLEDDELPAVPPSALVRLQALAEEAGGIDQLERIACGGDVETAAGGPDAATAGPAPAAELPAGGDGSAPPKPVVRRIWDRFFGSGGDPGAGGVRKAG